ncbi:MAG: sulfate ABC transporter permease subunit CysT [Deltaproteobacteria bacterium]|nr:sulfate ABC transporter permease subunit CysT [Deltaproteobacteria bacterium]
MLPLRKHAPNVLPGFGPTLGFSLAYLSLIVLVPLTASFFAAHEKGWEYFWKTIVSPRVTASYCLSFGASLVAAGLNGAFGFLVAWMLVRYRFPGRRLVDALVDLPFALPTAVAGIALTTVYSGNGWIGRVLERAGVRVAFTRLGVLVALIFVGLPFVVRTVQPVLEDLDAEMEEAAASLGAGWWRTFREVLFPPLWPALLTGFALAFARAVGEYGSVVFISGNLPYRTEITPFMIITKLEQYDLAGAAAVAVAMLAVSFSLLVGINFLQAWARRRHAAS